jgi:hypothetical protein
VLQAADEPADRRKEDHVTRQDLGSVLRFFAEIACRVKHEEGPMAPDDQRTRRGSDGSSHDIGTMAPPAAARE